MTFSGGTQPQGNFTQLSYLSHLFPIRALIGLTNRKPEGGELGGRGWRVESVINREQIENNRRLGTSMGSY